MTSLKNRVIWQIFIILLLTISACSPKPELPVIEAPVEQQPPAALEAEEQNQPAEEAPAEPPPPTPEPPKVTISPGEPPDPIRTLKDSVSNFSASEHKATQGDNFLNGLYERPFTSQEMIYQPDLDITTVDFAPGEEFFYFTIRLYAMNNEGGGLKGVYGIEFDRTKTGRGDLMVLAENPGKEWSMEGVTIYGDDNRDVGGPKPVIADEGFNGSGYDMTIEMEGDNAAFARLDPADPNAVQIAVSYALLNNPKEFLWGAWADNGMKDPAQFDYNDRMGPTAAGSPILGKYYPVKALYNLDNTCRLPYGLDQTTGGVPGMCINVAPVSSGGCRQVCTESPTGAAPTCETVCD